MELLAKTSNEEFLINDTFEVRDEVNFDVERSGPTRIYLPALYSVGFKIKANQDFEGMIEEKVPLAFNIFPLKDDQETKEVDEMFVKEFIAEFEQGNILGSLARSYNEVEEKGNFKVIRWYLSLKKGEEMSLAYRFNNSDINSQIYLLGPLKFLNGEEEAIFSEIRPWQLISEANLAALDAKEKIGRKIKFREKEVEFFHTDENTNENLIIISDQKTYYGLTQTEAYFSVSNVGDKVERVNLQTYFSNQQAEAVSLQKWGMDEKWQNLSLSSENLLKDSKNRKKTVPDGFIGKKSSEDKNQIVLNPGETQYFKMKIKFPINSSGEFYIEAVGDKEGYGLLDPWWEGTWTYKKPITVTYSGSSLSNFQILVTVDTQTLIFNSKMQNDCGDIRMIDSGEEVDDELDYWIESNTCDTTSTRIWVEVPSIAGNKTIYMYYGELDAPNVSNGPNTFVYFNDFESAVGFDAGDLNPTRTTGSAKYDTYGIYGAGGGLYKQETRDGIDSGRDLIWETWVRGKSSSSNCSLSGIGIGHPGGGTDKNGYQAYIDERGVVGIRENFNSTGLVCSKAATVNWNTWYFMKFYWTSGDALGISVYLDPNSSPIGDCAGSDNSYTDGEYGAAAYKDADWDDYRVRKYAATEPTTEIGSEIENADVIVDSSGTQTTNLDIPSIDNYVGGAFVITENISSRNVTGITITENGTVDADNDLSNIRLYYENDTSDPYNCAGESFSGFPSPSESTFGSPTTFNADDGTASFTGSVGISTTSTMCVYVVLDVDDTANNNDTLEIKINDPSTCVTVSSGTVSPDSAVEISDVTTLLTPPDLQQIHYRWRNDDGGEALNWLDPDWIYRKSHVINSSAGAGTNYQVKITAHYVDGTDSGSDVYLNSNSRTDFGDVRFTDDDGITPLDYWIESEVDSDNAVFWIEVKDDISTAAATILIYYGNAATTTTSNGISTFMFFDDFNDGDATGWTEYNGTWSVVDFDGSYRYYQSADTAAYLRTSNGSSGWTDYVVDTKIRIASGGATGGFAGVLVRFQDVDNHYATILDDRGDDLIWARRWLSGAYTGSSWTDISLDRDTWYDLEVEIFDSGDEETLESTFNGYTHQYNFSNFASGKIALMMHGTQAYYDDIRVRKYAPSEPSHGSWGIQETASASATWTADEDTGLTGLAKETLKRLRIEISNEGGQTASDVAYRLEVSEPNPSTCAAGTYERVSTDIDWDITDSSYIIEGEATFDVTPGLTDANDDFISGELRDIADETSAISLTGTQFTEIEYSIRTTTAAIGGATYCFRLTNAGSTANFTYIEAKYGKVTLEVVNQAPNSPSSLAQKKIDDSTLSVGDWTNETSVKFTAIASDPNSSDTLYLCVEKDDINTAFGDSEDLCGVGVGYTGGSVEVNVTITGITTNTEYHWQARVKDAATAYSSWVSYGGNSDTTPGADRDFGVDITAPTSGTIYDGTEIGVDIDFNDGSLSELSANWGSFDADVSGLDHYEYSIGIGIGGTEVGSWVNIGVGTSATATGLDLQTSAPYYFNVRAIDNAGNTQSAVSSDSQIVSPSLTFGISPTVLSFDNLNSGNSYTDTEDTTLTTSTNAYGGYVIRSFTTDYLRSFEDFTIDDFDNGTYESPGSWGGGNYGFGYTSSDSTIQGSDKFGSGTLYAPFSQSGPGDILADHTNNVTGTPITDEQFTVTYKVKTDNIQESSLYVTTTVYTATAIY